MQQRTLAKAMTATGVGLHSGEPVRLTIRPAPIGHGIVFVRSDVASAPLIRVSAAAVNDTRLSSTMVVDGVKVGTVEHLMSAFAALGLDNLCVEVDAPEMPIMDGSAAPFILLLKEAGVIEQPAPKRFLRVLKPIEVRAGDKWVRLTPFNGYKITLTIQFSHPVFARSAQTMTIDFADTSFLEAISRARTFGFMHEVEMMRQHGLGLGGSLDNAIVLDEYDVLNVDGLRYTDEFVRHKILDAIGDLYMLGHPLIAEFTGYKSGHALNNQLLRALLADESAYEWVEFATGSLDLPSAFSELKSIVV